MANDPKNIPIAEQARSGLIFDVRHEEGRVRFVAVPDPPDKFDADPDPLGILDRACGEAGDLRILTGFMWLFIVVVLVAEVPFAVGGRGPLILLVPVAVMVCRWWGRFGAIRSDNEDFRSAKRAVRIAAGTWILVFLLFGLRAIKPLVALLAGIHR